MSDPGQASTDLVRCRAEHAYPGRPLEVFWDGAWLAVTDVLEEYQTPSGRRFRVVCVGEKVFVLEYELATDRWTVSVVE